MANSYIILYGVLVIIAFPMFLQGQTLKVVKRSPDPTYMKLGDTLILNVTYVFSGSTGVGVVWRNHSDFVLIERFRGGGFDIVDSRASIEGLATLVLKNSQPYDNGTYTFQVNTRSRVVTENFDVIIQEKPTALINCSTPMTVKEGDHFECLCYSSGGNPPPIASWYKGGMKVSGPGYLKQTLLKNITKEDAGNYSCVVKSHDLNDTEQMEIHVQYKPTIISFKSDQKNNTVSVGKNVTITCKADAFPAPNYIIFHNGTQLTDAGNGVKTIKSVDLSYNGRYECVANNSVGNVSKSFNLTVKVPPTANTNCSTTVTVNEGGHFECLCFSIVGNPPPSASWYKDGTKYFNKTLSWKNITRKDAGIYTCIVKSLDLNDTKQVNIQVYYIPTIISFKSEQGNNVSNGTSVTITCKAEALPAPNYIIFHNDDPLLGAVNGTIIIKSVSLSDNGYYKCVANNSLGNVSASLNLTVKVRPIANISCLTAVAVKEGDNFTCLCNSIGGYPPPSASWYKGGTGYLTKTLSLKNVKIKDAGTYSCVVKSLDFNDTIQVNIQVHYKPTNISFTSVEGNIVSVGTSVTIICKAEALPAPEYIIFHNNKTFLDDVHGTKTIDPVSVNDNGYYKCVARNSLGNMSAILNLTVTDTTTKEELSAGVIVGIAVGGVILLLLIVVLLWWCHCCTCCNRCPCYNRWCGYEEKLNSTDGRIPENGISNVVADCGAYESVDKAKLGSVADQAGTSEDPAPASPPAMPPVYAVVDKSVKKKLPPIERKLKPDEEAGPSSPSLSAVYAVVDKSVKRKLPPLKQKPESLTYASLDPVALQPDSSKMRNRTREESNYADIDMTDIHGEKT